MPVKVFFAPAQRCSMADVALLVQDAQGLLAAALVQLVADRLAGDRLVLADVGERAERLGLARRRS